MWRTYFSVRMDYPSVPNSANVFHMAKKISQPGQLHAELGKQIAHAMIDAGMGSNNSELSRRTGLSKQTIGRALSGEREFGITEYTLIAEALGLTFLELITRTDEALKRSEED